MRGDNGSNENGSNGLPTYFREVKIDWKVIPDFLENTPEAWHANSNEKLTRARQNLNNPTILTVLYSLYMRVKSIHAVYNMPILHKTF